MEPGALQQPVFGFGGQVTVEVNAVGVPQPGHGGADPVLVRSAADDVHLDAGPRLGQLVDEAGHTFQPLVPDEAADGDQAYGRCAYSWFWSHGWGRGLNHGRNQSWGQGWHKSQSRSWR